MAENDSPRIYNDKNAPPAVVPLDPRSWEWPYRHDRPSRKITNFYNDRSRKRISGISGSNHMAPPPNFYRNPPFLQGDILEIKDEYDNEYGKQGVFDKELNGFIYFSCNYGAWKREAADLKRIHWTEYRPR